MFTDEDFVKLDVYVQRVDELCARVENDIKKGDKFTSDTVLALARLISARNAVADLLVAFDGNSEESLN